MSYFHAAVWIDHQEAQILQFNAGSVELQKVHAHKHDTSQRDSKVRSEHKLLDEVWADFSHYVTKHSPAISPRMVGWEIIDPPTDRQLVALAKNYWVKYDQRGGKRAISNLNTSGSVSETSTSSCIKNPDAISEVQH